MDFVSAVSHAQLLNTIQHITVQWSPFSEHSLRIGPRGSDEKINNKNRFYALIQITAKTRSNRYYLIRTMHIGHLERIQVITFN